jgi:hypothetical protein
MLESSSSGRHCRLGVDTFHAALFTEQPAMPAPKTTTTTPPPPPSTPSALCSESGRDRPARGRRPRELWMKLSSRGTPRRRTIGGGKGRRGKPQRREWGSTLGHTALRRARDSTGVAAWGLRRRRDTTRSRDESRAHPRRCESPRRAFRVEQRLPTAACGTVKVYGGDDVGAAGRTPAFRHAAAGDHRASINRAEAAACWDEPAVLWAA